MGNSLYMYQHLGVW